MNFFLKIFRALRKRKEPPGNNRVSGGLTLAEKKGFEPLIKHP